jgi:HAD superfamily hydrolase (TIGR01549 family)
MKGVLFDLDGVITSERIYWNCSGLAIARYLNKETPDDLEGKIETAKRHMPDEAIRSFKERGINSNWDITYAASVLSETDKSLDWFLGELENRDMRGMDYISLLDEIDPSHKHDREGGPWEKAHESFQSCYYELEDTDEPVISLDRIKSALEELKNGGLGLGIVTGRPYNEAKKPLKNWKIWDFFDEDMIITEREVREESERRGRHMGKPDPWPILKAVREGDNASDYVFVGDSVSDVLAAKNAGMPIICVNTGIASKKSLTNAGADKIVDDVSDVPAALKEDF